MTLHFSKNIYYSLSFADLATQMVSTYRPHKYIVRIVVITINIIF